MKTGFGVDYGSWRAGWRGEGRMREDGKGVAPPERLLQAIWRHQRLQRDGLVTAQGEPLLVLHPGFWNRGSGPDFRQAVLQFGSQPPLTGDVEIDQTAQLWVGHHHDQNPAYRQVILQVVWEDGPAGRRPALAIKDRLDAPLSELELWLCGEGGEMLPEIFRGHCSPCLARAEAREQEEILRQAGRARLVSKARELQARARQAGWEQALWEGLFRGLGYKQNPWPMQRMAELLPLVSALDQGQRQPLAVWQARLLGLAGFLQREAASVSLSAERYLAQTWDQWWRVQSELADYLLPRACWRLHGLRPANHPQRRLALAAHWLASGDLVKKLEDWFGPEQSLSRQAAQLSALLAPEQDPFWSVHWTLRSRACSQSHNLLGHSRITDLAVNIILPWFWVRAESAGNSVFQQRVEDLYYHWPAAEDNAVLRLARARLLGGGSSRLFAQAASQQGLLQIVHDFCERSNAVCQDCPFPDFLGGLSKKPEATG
jgi:hypothetical protein